MAYSGNEDVIYISSAKEIKSFDVHQVMKFHIVKNYILLFYRKERTELMQLVVNFFRISQYLMSI